jgi:hypothetical protein
MAECMHKQVIKKVKEIIASSKYLALSCDEVTTIDGFISIPMLFEISVTYLYSFLLSKLLKEGV